MERLNQQEQHVKLLIEKCERKIKCKRIAEQTGTEARFYENSSIEVLTEPVKHYEDHKKQCEEQLREIQDAIKDLESRTCSKPISRR